MDKLRRASQAAGFALVSPEDAEAFSERAKPTKLAAKDIERLSRPVKTERTSATLLAPIYYFFSGRTPA